MAVANSSIAEPSATIRHLRPQFDAVYDKFVLNSGFFEEGDYYAIERPRYWRSLEFLSSLEIPRPARILEIGGGQMAILRKHLFGDQCTVGDISRDYVAPLEKAGVDHVILNLLSFDENEVRQKFDVIILLEVIEHLPVPAYVIFEKLKTLLAPSGTIFLTTPNLFRLRNLARMAAGIDYLDVYTFPQPGVGLGHQLEYTAQHLRWQLEKADMDIIMLEHDRLGRIGHSFKARMARRLIAPLELRAKWRDHLVAAASTRKVSS